MPPRTTQPDRGELAAWLHLWATSAALEIRGIIQNLNALAHRALEDANAPPAEFPVCVGHLAFEIDALADGLKALLDGTEFANAVRRDLSSQESSALLAIRIVRAPGGQAIIPEALEQVARRLRTEPPSALILAWFATNLDRLAEDLRQQDYPTPTLLN
jgi:hypothetical protein